MYVELLKTMFIAMKKTALLRSALVKSIHIWSSVVYYHVVLYMRTHILEKTVGILFLLSVDIHVQDYMTPQPIRLQSMQSRL